MQLLLDISNTTTAMILYGMIIAHCLRTIDVRYQLPFKHEVILVGSVTIGTVFLVCLLGGIGGILATAFCVKFTKALMEV